VHRDVKPSTILVSSRRGRDFAYLIDFGIAQRADGTRLTATGSAIGTVAYLAPERVNGEEGDHRADIYSLGCVLHEVLTGRTAFTATNPAAMRYAHRQAPPRPSAQVRGLPPELDGVIATALATDPGDRFAHAGLLAEAATAAVRSAAPTAPPTAPPASG
jgi:serine/threonine-protein kinase